jgi:hypothetical protein
MEFCLHARTVSPPEPIRRTWHRAVPAKDTGERGLAALAGRRLRSREPRWVAMEFVPTVQVHGVLARVRQLAAPWSSASGCPGRHGKS